MFQGCFRRTAPQSNGCVQEVFSSAHLQLSAFISTKLIPFWGTSSHPVSKILPFYLFSMFYPKKGTQKRKKCICFTFLPKKKMKKKLYSFYLFYPQKIEEKKPWPPWLPTRQELFRRHPDIIKRLCTRRLTSQRVEIFLLLLFFFF